MGQISTFHVNSLLIVGPLPPPLGGSGLTVKAMIEELAKHTSVRFEIINTSPYTDPRKPMTGFKVEKVFRSVLILFKYLQRISQYDAVLVYANPLFTFTIVPFLLVIAHSFHKSFYIKPVGGDLDSFLKSRSPFSRKYCLTILKKADGIFSQTQLLQGILEDYGINKAHYIPGFRSYSSVPKDIKQNSNKLQLIFLGHITREKGTLILLDALQILSNNPDINFSCDFFGIIHDDIHEEFSSRINTIANAHYCGIAQAGSGIDLISKYDVLVLPTFFISEGHPGVIIEAMMASVPVISTQHRSIPELITNGKNGILIPAQDSQALVKAIQWANDNRDALRRMGEANKLEGVKYSADIVVTKMLDIMFA